MAWYDTGTVAVTNGSTTVTGTGTNFITGAQVGEAFYGPDSKLYEIQSITSATVIILADAYFGSTQSGQSYQIVPTQSLVADLAVSVTDLISDFADVRDYAGNGKFNDGSVGTPAITFTQDQDNGLYRIGANNWALAAGGQKIVDVSTSGVAVTGTASFTGEITANGGIALGDSDKATFGASDDLQIYHDGFHSNIKETGAGSLIIDAANTIFRNADATKTYAFMTDGGAIDLYHNNALKLATTSTGIDVTGTATMDGLVVEGNGALFTLDNGSNAATLSNTNGNVVLDYDAAEAGRSFTVQQNGRKSLRVNNSGDVSFYEDTGTTPKFFWDASAETLTVGGDDSTTATSLNTLVLGEYADASSGAVLRSSAASAINFEDSNASTAGRIYYNHTSDYMAFNTAASERLRLDSNGNVGIGTDTPAAKLDSQETYDTVANILTNGTYAAKFGGDTGVGAAGRAQGIMISGRNGTARGVAILAENQNSGNAHDLLFATSSNASVPAERMRIDSSGRVGIGTSSPASVSGGTSTHSTLTIGSTDGSMVVGDVAGALSFSTFDASYTGTYADGITSEIASVSESSVGGAYGLAFYTATTTGSNRAERMRIGASGNVGIGTSSPATALSVVGDITTTGGVYLGGTGAANKLDDYEEGTWTPSYGGSTGDPTATYINQHGNYTKVGNTVSFTLEVRTSAISGGSGSLLVKGLPFTANARHFECAVTMYYVTFNAAHSYTAEITASTNYMSIRGSTSGGADSPLDVSSVLNVNPSLIRITGTYQTA